MEQQDGGIAAPDQPRSALGRWAPLAVVVVAMAAAYLFGAHRYISMEAIVAEHERLRQFVDRHAALTLLAYVAVYVATVSLSIPGAAVLTLVGGFLFGWFWGGIATVAAATVGASIIFLIARSSFGRALRARAGPTAKRLSTGFQKDAWSYLLFLRLVFVVPFWLVNIAAALFDIPLKTFAGATALGIVPGTFAYAFLGAGLESIIAAQEDADPGCAAAGTCDIDLAALLTPTMIAALGLLALVSLLPILLKRLRRRRHHPRTAQE